MRDPVVYFAFLTLLLSLQLFIWLVARHVSDVPWWNTFGITFVVFTGTLIGTYVSFSFANVIATYLACGFIVWLVAGWLYEMEIWQRVVVSTFSPALGWGALIGASYFVPKIFGW